MCGGGGSRGGPGIIRQGISALSGFQQGTGYDFASSYHSVKLLFCFSTKLGMVGHADPMKWYFLHFEGIVLQQNSLSLAHQVQAGHLVSDTIE